MVKKILLGFAALFLLAALVFGLVVIRPIYQLGQTITPTTAAEDLAKQDDSRVEVPEMLALEPRPYDALKNVYWGELHVHTVESMDAVLFGTRATPEDAYRFARGEPLKQSGWGAHAALAAARLRGDHRPRRRLWPAHPLR